MTRLSPSRFLWFILATVLLLAGCPRVHGARPVVESLTDGEERALRVVQSALDISREQGAVIWPGYALHEVPLLVFRPEGRSLLVNPRQVSASRPPIGAPWLTEKVYAVASESLQVSANLPFAKEFEIDGNQAFLIRHLNGTKDRAFFRLLVHEVFHYHQHRHWQSTDYPEVCRYPYEDRENTFLLRLEEKALAYLLALGENEQLADQARIYVALRHARYGAGIAGEAAMGIEEWEELIEGTARYVEEFYAIAAGYATRTTVTEELVAYLTRLHPKDLQKWKYYRTGAALAMILDVLDGGDWKARCGDGGGPFPALAGHVAPLTDDDAQQVATWRSRYADQKEAVDDAIQAYLASEEVVLARWRSEGRYEVRIDLPARGTAYYTNRGMTMLLADCERLASGIVSFVDRTYGLEVQHRGVAVRNDPEGFHIRFYHNLQEGTLRLDEQAIPDAPGRWGFAHTIEVVYPEFRLKWAGEGYVLRQDDAVRLVLTATP
jgi:hypothetical protein